MNNLTSKKNFQTRKETKKMKKVLAIILMMTMVISLFAACGNNKPASNVIDPDFNNNTDIENNAVDNNNSVQNNTVSTDGFASSKEEFLEKIGKLVDMSLYEVDDEDENYVSVDLKIENSKSFNFDYTIKFDNDKVTIPVSFADMKNSVFSTELAEDFSVSNKVQKGAVYTTADGKELTLWTTNLDAFFDDAESTCDLKDCTFYAFSAYVYTEEYDENDAVYYEKDTDIADFDINGINPDSTVEAVLNAIKTPSGIDYDKESNNITIRYSEKIGDSNTTADYSSLTVSFFADQNCIERIKYEYAPAAVK